MAKRLSKSAVATDFAENATSIDGALNPPVDAKTDTKYDNRTKSEKADNLEKISQSQVSVVVANKQSITKHLKSLDGAFDTVKKAFFTIGFNLYWFDDTGAFQQIGKKEYKSISDFAKDRYGLSKTTTYSYLSVIKRFGKINPETGEVDALQDEYKAYSSTALIVMSGMTDEQLARCTADMKVKQLKAILADTDLLENNGMNENDTGENDTNENEGLKEFKSEKKSNAVELYSITSVEDFEKRSKEILNGIKKTLMQDNNGVKYHVSIVMTW